MDVIKTVFSEWELTGMKESGIEAMLQIRFIEKMKEKHKYLSFKMVDLSLVQISIMN